jgi:ligand-binding sensor domain-containing protein/signal transduction histidine kinase
MTKKHLLCFFLPVFLLFMLKARAQSSDAFTDNYTRFISFSTNQGLSNAFATDILQDKYGFIWIATQNGLNKFDGTGFVQYYYQLDDPHSLSDNLVTSLAEDTLGNLWIGTKNGLCRYERSTNDFIRFSTSAYSKPRLSDNYVRALYADKNGYLWIETLNGGLDCIDISSNTKKNYPHTNPVFEGDYFYHFIFEDSKGRIWIGTRNYTPRILNKETGDFQLISGSNGNDGSSLFEDDNHIISNTGNYGIFFFDEKTQQFSASPEFKIPFRVQTTLNDHEGNIWFGGAGDKILRFDQKRHQWTAFVHMESNPNSVISTEINKIYKDRQGNIWFATTNGISAIPGEINKFRHYRNIPGINSLHSDKVTALLQDSKGILWIGTKDNGLDTVNLKKEQFGNLKYQILTRDIDQKTFEKEKDVLKQYSGFGFIRSEQGTKVDRIFDSYDAFRNAHLSFSKNDENNVSVLYEDKQGSIWIGCWNDIGFNRFSYTNGFKRNSIFTRGLSPVFSNELWCSNFYSDFLEDSNHNFWMATWEGIGLNLYNREKSQFEGRYYYGRGKSLDGKIYYLHKQNDSTLWLSPGGTLIAFLNTQTDRLKAFVSDKFPDSRLDEIKYLPYSGLAVADMTLYGDVTGYITDKEGFTWVYSGNGDIFKYSVKENRFESYSLGNNFREQIVAATYSPDQHCIYLGSMQGDLYAFDCLSHKLRKTGPVQITKSDQKNIVQYLTWFDNKVWVGLSKGLALYNPKQNQLTYYEKLPGLANGILKNISSFVSDGDNLYFNSGNRIFIYNGRQKKFHDITDKLNPGFVIGNINVIRYANNALWIGALNGLYKTDLVSGKLNIFRHDGAVPNSLPENQIQSLEIVKDELYVATIKGLCKINTKTNRLTLLNQIPPDRLSSRLLTRLFEDKAGYLWIGTTELGVNRLDLRTNIIDHFFEQEYDSTSLLGNNVESIIQDRKGNIWIGTDKGLNRFIEAKKSFIRYASFGKYNCGSIKAIREDNAGNLWISTSNGLLLFNTDRNEVVHLTFENGLQDNSFSNASTKLRDGRLAFGGQNGITVFDPSAIHPNQGFPEVIIENVRINDSLLFADFAGQHSLILKYYQNNISLIPASSEYFSPSLIHYRYRLRGFEKEWNYAGDSDKAIKYNNLKPGKYNLDINTTNIYGKWNPVINTISITVSSPWWVTWWFRGLSFIAIIGCIYAIIRIREASLKEARIKLEKTVTERTRELAETNRRLSESERQLAETLAAKDKFFSIVAHDLKNPVLALRNISDRLITEFEKLPKQQQLDLLSSMNKQIHLTYSFLDNLLLWALSQKNAVPFYPQACNLSQLVKEVIMLLDENARMKKIMILSDVKDECIVFADRNMLLTILNNLLSNAIKFSYPGGTVRLDAGKTDGFFKVSVKDEGTGIPATMLDNLFRISSKYRTVGTAKESGTGTGLLLCKEFVEKNGGKIRVESVEGKGSIFCFTLPEYRNLQHT